jgi:DNA-binding IclR family transcriptional regulator
MEAGEPMSPADIAVATGMKSPNTRQLLLKMTRAGEVVKQERSQYAHPNVTGSGAVTPDNNDNIDNISYLAAKEGGYQ